MVTTSDVAQDPNLKAMLCDGMAKLNITTSELQQSQLLEFLGLLTKWNQAYNLSGIKSPEAMVTSHLLDSLAISPYIDAKILLDVGTGAGLPGIPLAIMHPDKTFILLDSNGKKTRFLFQVQLALGLENIRIENKRIENYQCPEQIDIVMSRAFSSLRALTQLSASVLKGSGRLLAMKGQWPQEELDDLPPTSKVLSLVELDVPGLQGKRHLVEIEIQDVQEIEDIENS
jgi:16S rRNA (guanine527-N7)-methyltransferase